MSRPWSDAADELFVAGLVLAAISGGLALLLFPDPVNQWAAPLFLLLCLPKGYRRVRAVCRSRSNEVGPRTAMATVTSLSFHGRDDSGDAIYGGTVAIEGDGSELTLHWRDYPDDEVELLKSLTRVPIEYVPPAGSAEVRIDLVKLVRDCGDPIPDV